MKAVAFITLLVLSIHVSAQKDLFCHAMRSIPDTRNPDEIRGCAPLDNNYHFWDVGKVLYVKFLNGSPQIHSRIMTIAKQWEQYGNLTFQFVDSGQAQIRVGLHAEGYVSSMLGTMANIVPEDEANVLIDTSFFTSVSSMEAIVLHLFGHVLGFQHEIKVPLTGRSWNRKNIDKYFDSFGWTQEEIQKKVIDVYSFSYSNGLAADPFSVMNVPLPGGWTKEESTVWKKHLSDGDKLLMQLVYPDSTDKHKEPASMIVTGFEGIRIKQTKSGFIFYPELELSVRNIKSLIFYVFLADEEGKPINNSLEEPVGVSLKYSNKGDKVYAINKSANDFGFFIPYADIPLKYECIVLKAFFNIYYIDSEYEQKAGYRSNPQDLVWKR